MGNPEQQFEAILSTSEDSFKVLTHGIRKEISQDCDELMPLSSIEFDSPTHDFQNTVIYLTRSGRKFSVVATVDIPDAVIDAYINPFRTMCQSLEDREDTLFRDKDTIVQAYGDTLAHSITRMQNADGEPSNIMTIHSVQCELEERSIGSIAEFAFGESEDAISLVIAMGETVGRVVNLMQQLDGEQQDGRMLLALPTMPEYLRFPRYDDLVGLERHVGTLENFAFEIANADELAQEGLARRNAILLEGEPGNGKSELARAFARYIRASYMRISSSDIMDMYVGKPAQNIRKAFQEASGKDGLCVLHIEECDGLFNKNAGGNAGVARALNAEVKAIMDNAIEQYPNVILVASTNSTDNFDPALLRRGRFDIVLKLGNPNESVRDQLFTKFLYQHSGHFATVAGIELEMLDISTLELAKLTEKYSSADIKNFVQDLIRNRITQKHRNGTTPPPLTQGDLNRAIAEFNQNRPSMD